MGVVTDPIADMLTRIRNGLQARHPKVDVPASKLKSEIARIENAHHNAATALAEERRRIEALREQANELRREKKMERCATTTSHCSPNAITRAQRARIRRSSSSRRASARESHRAGALAGRLCRIGCCGAMPAPGGLSSGAAAACSVVASRSAALRQIRFSGQGHAAIYRAGAIAGAIRVGLERHGARRSRNGDAHPGSV